MGLLRLILNKIKQIRHSIELNKYDCFTIAEYFRKQGAQIGEGCSIIPRFLGTEPYLVKIGNNVNILKDVNFITHDGGAWIFRKEIPDLQVFGTIIIGDNCVIGQNVILFPNIAIGNNSIVVAGSVVISDIPENSIALGVPARVFDSVDKYREKCIAKWTEQKPSDLVIEDRHNWKSSEHFQYNRKKLKKHLMRLFWHNA